MEMNKMDTKKCDDSMLPMPADGEVFHYDDNPRFDKIIWAYGFRPFLLLGAGYAIAGIFLWSAYQMGWLEMPDTIPVAGWHAHEMIFGFGGAALCGFLLTSVSEWTETKPVIGKKLALFVALWLAGRIAMWLSGILPLFLVAAINLAMLPILFAWTMPHVWQERHRRHISFIPLLPLLWSAQIIAFMGWMGFFDHVTFVDDISMRAMNAGLHIILIAIVLVVTRVSMVLVPTALDEQGDNTSEFRPLPPRRNLAVTMLIFFAIADFVAPDNAITGWIALAAAAAQFDRMADWHVGRVLLKPYVLTVYIAYAWLAIGLTGIGFHALFDWDIFQSSRHALTMGCVGTAVLGVFVIAGLRHTCRDMVIEPLILVAVFMISIATLLRAGVPIFFPDAYQSVAIGMASLVWSAAFALWLFIFGPYMLKPRSDGQPG
jgi:uncharacterized protein involved in response to NO